MKTSLKFYAIFCVFVLEIFAKHPPQIDENHAFLALLSDKGEMSGDLKARKCGKDIELGEISLCFDGELTLTGVLVREDNDNGDTLYDALRFYPDKNAFLPFLFSTFDIESVENLDFERLKIGVLIEKMDKIKLPKPMNSRIFGTAFMRARVKMREYRVLGEGEAAREAYATLISFTPISEIHTQTPNLSEIKPEKFEAYFDGSFKQIAIFAGLPLLKYASKDEFINIRATPNGRVIAKIHAADYKNGGKILLADGVGLDSSNLEPFFTKNAAWVEVFYLPPKAKNTLEALHGYIHSSQLGLK